MKKVLLILFVLAICVLAFPQGVSADVPKDVTINALYGSATVFDVTNNLESGGLTWNLQPGQDNVKVDALSFSVTSQSAWTVTGTASDAGFMRGSQGTLIDAFQMTVPTDGYKDFTVPPLTVNGAGPSPSAVPWNANINQHVENNDLGSNVAFAITLYFNCAAGF